MINNKNKDRLFAFIFGREENKAWTLDLYNAVNGTAYSDPSEIELNTMSDTVYMGRKNDVSFIMCGTMNLYEHQSAYNPNMPLRQLMYAGRLYDKHIKQKKQNIYSKKIIEIPMPKLVVFYNGTYDEPDEVILELKDSFPQGLDPAESDIQVRARMLNINKGHNKELMKKCRPLLEYSKFIAGIRQNKQTCETIEAAIDKALEELPEDSLLHDFLLGNKAEVKNMCITEYNEEETMEMFKQEFKEDGQQELAATIKSLRSGTSESVLLESGIKQETIDLAKSCL